VTKKDREKEKRTGGAERDQNEETRKKKESELTCLLENSIYHCSIGKEAKETLTSEALASCC